MSYSTIAFTTKKLHVEPRLFIPGEKSKMAANMKIIASAAIDASSQELCELSSEIWKNPELGFKEYKAHELLTSFLEKKGFAVERSFTGIETAFRATFGSGRPNVCVICEYDALPEIGHACGHNLIAEAGVAAGLGLKAALESSDAPKGRVTVLGTPAEEGEGGKINLIENGAFEEVDTAMMVHPSPTSIIAPGFLAHKQLSVTYTGKASHAGAFPWEGVNALDAAVLAYNSISVLRQQMKPTWRVHGVALNGGTDPAVIPDKTHLLYYIRTPMKSELDTLEQKVVACFQAAAKATGCQVEIKQKGATFEDLLSNDVLGSLYAKNFESLGENCVFKKDLTISTDMGNVTYTVPSIHPMYAVGSGELNHTNEFREVSNTPEAHSATLIAAKAMTHTCIDVLTTEGLLEEIKVTFKNSISEDY